MYGRSLAAQGRRRARVGDDFLLCLLPDGTWTLVPEWMTSPERCATAVLVDAPVTSVAALLEVEHVVATTRSPRPADASIPPAIDIPRTEVSDAGAARRAQLRLEWRDEETTVGWSELSAATRAELRALLAEVLRHAAVGGERAEGGDE